MENKNIELRNGYTLEELNKDPTYYLNRTTFVIGRTQSGKSTIIKEIMYLCKKYISIVFIVSKTGNVNNDFHGMVPSNCIKSEISIEKLEEIVSSQKDRAELYAMTHNLDIFYSVIKKINDINLLRKIKNTVEKIEVILHKIENDESIDKNKKTLKKIEAKKKLKEYKYKKFEQYILDHKSTIFEKHKSNVIQLNKDELLCVKFIDFNPNFLLVIDDCASELKKWNSKSTFLKDILYNGRHNKITFIVSAQNDKEIEPGLRKNSMVNIFTTSQAVNSNFENTTNSFSKYDKNIARLSINGLNNAKDNFKKLVYLQQPLNNKQFYYTKANVYDNFRLGCESLWKLAEELNNKLNHNKKMNNRLYNKFNL